MRSFTKEEIREFLADYGYTSNPEGLVHNQGLDEAGAAAMTSRMAFTTTSGASTCMLWPLETKIFFPFFESSARRAWVSFRSASSWASGISRLSS